MASIRKVKLVPGTVEIHTSSLVGKQATDSVIKSYEVAHPDLENAFNDLVKSVYDILNLDRSWCVGLMKVTSVSFSESETGIRGAVITGQVRIPSSDAPFCFNTPHLPFQQYNPTGSARVMPGSAVERLEKVLIEAASFMTGKRAQMELLP